MGRILVVDDERSITMMLRMILEGEGMKVVTANSAAEAQTILAKAEFDLVMTDMRMESPTSGMEVAGFAKSAPSKPSVMILSAYPLHAADWAGFADAYLQKGGSVDDMLQVIANLLRVRAA
jgi:CheY-like chemotaxis protein